MDRKEGRKEGARVGIRVAHPGVMKRNDKEWNNDDSAVCNLLLQVLGVWWCPPSPGMTGRSVVASLTLLSLGASNN